MNALKLVQQVCDELSLFRPTALIGSADPQVRQLMALLNRLGADITRQTEWNRLDKEYLIVTNSFTLTGTVTNGSKVITGLPTTTAITDQYTIIGPGIQPFAQVVTVNNLTEITMDMEAVVNGTVSLQFSQNKFDLPSDWQRQIPQTEWNRTQRWALLGPKSSQEWQTFKSGIVSAGPRQRFRILNNQLALNPSPPDGQTLSFEYISNGWVEGADGVAKPEITADTDTFIFTDSLLITGLKSQWMVAKGLDASFSLGEFRWLLEQEKATNKSAPMLSVGAMQGSVLLTNQNILDGSWPDGH
jgi:hypothetical protein